MEALSGLGAHCDIARTKGDNGPAVQLLSHTLDTFLDLVLKLVLFRDFDSNQMEPASEALFAMICARHVSPANVFFSLAVVVSDLAFLSFSSFLFFFFQGSFNAIAEQIIAQIPQEEARARLSGAFSLLLTTNNLEAKLDRKNNGRFKENLEKFLMNVRGFLRVK